MFFPGIVGGSFVKDAVIHALKNSQTGQRVIQGAKNTGQNIVNGFKVIGNTLMPVGGNTLVSQN